MDGLKIILGLRITQSLMVIGRMTLAKQRQQNMKNATNSRKLNLVHTQNHA